MHHDKVRDDPHKILPTIHLEIEIGPTYTDISFTFLLSEAILCEKYIEQLHLLF